jgi:hypothetical protein
MRLIVAGQARIHFHQHAVVETESRLHIGGALGAANEKSGRREQHQREGNLAHHQDVSTGEEPAPLPGGYVFMLAIFETGNNVRLEQIPGWRQAEQKRAEQTETHGRCQNTKVGPGGVNQIDRSHAG